MLEEIQLKYSDFHDASILRIDFTEDSNLSVIAITILCMNAEKGYEYEKIKILLSNIQFFNIKYSQNMGLLSPFSVLLTEDAGSYIIDFDCVYISENKLKVNSVSDFIIKCRTLSYQVL